MRVLWFTNGSMPAVDRHIHHTPMGSGHWMISLLERLSGRPGLKLDVATAHPGYPDARFDENGIGYFVQGQPVRQSIFYGTKRDFDWCTRVIRECRPDVVHIHGSERFYGLVAARKLTEVPCVISLQGFLGPCTNAFFGALSPMDIWRSTRLIELPIGRGLINQYRQFRAAARQEREILSGCQSFMGRTEWDRAYLASINPGANYHHVGEILRAPFYKAVWNPARCERHTIVFTNAGEPWRGTEVLLRALAIVRREFPDAKLLLAGHIGNRRGYDRFVRRSIQESGVASAVEHVGYLDADGMVKHLQRANVFAMASYIENSSNSLCEAMHVGLPCVATYTGGITSLVDHGRTGLLTPAGDPVLLASAIGRVFRDEALATNLGRAARAAASERHAPETVISQLLGAYGETVGNTHHEQPAFAR